MSNDEALRGAIAWLLTLREKAREDLSLAGHLLDTQPDGVSMKGLQKILNDPSSLSEAEKSLVQQGKFLLAIKEVRCRTGLLLKEAKDLVDGWISAERQAGRLPPPS